MGKTVHKKNKQKIIVMNESEVKKLKREVSDDAFRKAVVLILAYEMDNFDYDAQRIADAYSGLDRYLNAIKEHLITVKKVEAIIKENSNLEIEW